MASRRQNLLPSAYAHISGIAALPDMQRSAQAFPRSERPFDSLVEKTFFDESEMLKKKRERLETEIELLRRERSRMFSPSELSTDQSILYERRKSEYARNESDYDRIKYERDRKMDSDIAKIVYGKDIVDYDMREVGHDKSRYGSDMDRVDYERRKVDPDKSRYGFDMDRVDYERRKVDLDKSRYGSDKDRVDYERRKVDPDKSRYGSDKDRVDYDRRNVDLDKLRYGSDKDRGDYDRIRSRIDYDKDQDDYDRRRVVYEKDRVDYDWSRADYDKDSVDYTKVRYAYDKERVDYDRSSRVDYDRSSRVDHRKPRYDYDKDRVDYDKDRVDFDESRVDYDIRVLPPKELEFQLHGYAPKDYVHSGGYYDEPQGYPNYPNVSQTEVLQESSYDSGYSQDLPHKWKYSAKDNELNATKKKKGGALTEFLCKECNITCNTQQVMDSHLAGKNHAKKLEKLGLPSGTGTVIEVPVKQAIPSKSEQRVEDDDDDEEEDEIEDGPEEYCNVCHKGFRGSYKKHVRNPYHKKCALTCSKCCEVFETLEDFDAHNYENHRDDKKEAGKPEQVDEKKKEKLEPKGMDEVEQTEGLYCRLCLVFFHGDFVSRLAHCSSKMHVEKAKEQIANEETNGI